MRIIIEFIAERCLAKNFMVYDYKDALCGRNSCVVLLLCIKTIKLSSFYDRALKYHV